MADPFSKACRHSRDGLNGKVEKLELKLEAMSDVVLRLMKENERLKSMADTVPRHITENEGMKAMTDTFIKLKSRVNSWSRWCEMEGPVMTNGQTELLRMDIGSSLRAASTTLCGESEKHRLQ
jgi:hypothetical protein